MQEVLHDNKRALKHQLRAWELAFEEQNGGLVATHADKKRPGPALSGMDRHAVRPTRRARVVIVIG